MNSRSAAHGLLALALAGALCAPGFGGEEEGPDARARRVAASLPEPADTLAFDVSCDVLEGGSALYGRLRLAAAPAALEGGAVGWRVAEVMEPAREGAARVESEAWLDRGLNALRGRYRRENEAGFLEGTWRAGPAGFTLEYVTTEYENLIEAPVTGLTLSTLPALLLFLRMAPAEAARYEVHDLEVNPAAGDPFLCAARIQVHGIADWRVGEAVVRARIATFTRGKSEARVALDAESGAFLGLEFLGQSISIAPHGAGPVGLAKPDAPELETPWQRAAARARTVRASLPQPARRHAWSFDLLLEDCLLGRARVTARPASYRGRAVWSCAESSMRAAGEGRVTWETTSFAARDLAVLRGERLLDAPEGRTVSSFRREGQTITTVHESGGERSAAVATPLRSGALCGKVPVILFLLAAPRQETSYLLPAFDPRWARLPKTGSGSYPANLADVHVEVLGPGRFDADGSGRSSWVARCSKRTGEVYEVHLDPEGPRLLGVAGIFPKLSLVPEGTGGKTPGWFDGVDSEAQSARQAFVKFGRGYHTPRRDLLADAFHWPSMLAYEVRKGRYVQGTDLGTFRQDWTEVFVSMSKHRTEADCDDLLVQMFMTSTERKNADGSVTMQTLPVYGGHAYRMKEVDGRWQIVGIDVESLTKK